MPANVYKHKITGDIRSFDSSIIDAWEAANNPKATVWEIYVAPPPPSVPLYVPYEIGPAQLRAAMVTLGWITIVDPKNADKEIDTWLESLVDAVVTDVGQKTVALILLRRATGFKRDHPLIAVVAAAAGKTETDIDQLFHVASTF